MLVEIQPASSQHVLLHRSLLPANILLINVRSVLTNLLLNDRDYEYQTQKFPAQDPQDFIDKILIIKSKKKLLLSNTHILSAKVLL